jgi:hypothetical protein
MDVSARKAVQFLGNFQAELSKSGFREPNPYTKGTASDLQETRTSGAKEAAEKVGIF